MKMKKWIALLLAALLMAVVPTALAEGLEIEEEPVIEESEEIVFSEDVDNAAEEEDFMLFSDEPIEKGYADFLTESAENDGDIPIDTAHFPDANFRAYVSSKCDTNGDRLLSDQEIYKVTSIDVHEQNISSLQGIGYFSRLFYLQCNKNNLKSLDLTGCDELATLWCTENQLTHLNISGNTELRYLFAGANQLEELDVSQNTALVDLACGENQLTGLDVSKNAALESLNCFRNQLVRLDVGKNPLLRNLVCFEN